MTLTQGQEDRLAALLSSISAMPGQSFGVELGQVAMSGHAQPDSDDPSLMSSGDLNLDIEGFDLPPNITPTDAIRVTITTMLVSAMHEVAEWLRVDGERVFTPHTDSYQEWEILADIASNAATRMMAEHP